MTDQENRVPVPLQDQEECSAFPIPAADQQRPRAGAGRGRSEGSRRTQFQKGRSGNPAGRPRGIPSRRTNPLLRDCRKVADQERERDATPCQRALRKMFDEDFWGFIRLLDRLEREDFRERR